VPSAKVSGVKVTDEQVDGARPRVCGLAISFGFSCRRLLVGVCFPGRKGIVFLGPKGFIQVWFGGTEGAGKRAGGQRVGNVTPCDDCFYNKQKPNLNSSVLL